MISLQFILYPILNNVNIYENIRIVTFHHSVMIPEIQANEDEPQRDPVGKEMGTHVDLVVGISFNISRYHCLFVSKMYH